MRSGSLINDRISNFCGWLLRGITASTKLTNFEELVALSPGKQWMLTALDSGALESTRKKADERFGH